MFFVFLLRYLLTLTNRPISKSQFRNKLTQSKKASSKLIAQLDLVNERVFWDIKCGSQNVALHEANKKIKTVNRCD
jgi:hypothetical protein